MTKISASRATFHRDVAVGLFGNAASPAMSIISAPLLAQTLGVNGRGVLAAATAPLLLAMAGLTLGIPDALTYAASRQALPKPRVVVFLILLLFFTGIVGVTVVALARPLLSGGDSDLGRLTLLATLCLPFSLFTLALRGIAAGRGSWRLVAIEKALGATLRLLALCALLRSGGLTVGTAVVVVATTTAVGGIVYVRLASSASGEIAGVAPMRARATVGYGLRAWWGSLAGILVMRLDQLLMTPLSDSAQLGLYAVAVSVSEVVLVLNSAVRDVMLTRQASAQDFNLLARATRVSTALTALASVILGAISVPLFPFLFGSAFSTAIPVLWVLLAAVTFGNSGSIVGAGLSARGRPEVRSFSLVVALVVNAGLVLLLVPVLGAMGAALATFVTNVIAASANLIWLHRLYSVPLGRFLRPQLSDFGLPYGTLLRIRQ